MVQTTVISSCQRITHLLVNVNLVITLGKLLAAIMHTIRIIFKKVTAVVCYSLLLDQVGSILDTCPGDSAE